MIKALGSSGTEDTVCVSSRSRPSGRRLQTHLYSRRDAVDDLDGAAVRVARQRLPDAVDLHLAFGLSARLLAVDRLTGGTLQAAVLRRSAVTKRSVRSVDRLV